MSNLFDCKPRLTIFLSSFGAAYIQRRLTTKAACIFLFTLTKGQDDAQPFLG